MPPVQRNADDSKEQRQPYRRRRNRHRGNKKYKEEKREEDLVAEGKSKGHPDDVKVTNAVNSNAAEDSIPLSVQPARGEGHVPSEEVIEGQATGTPKLHKHCYSPSKRELGYAETFSPTGKRGEQKDWRSSTQRRRYSIGANNRWPSSIIENYTSVYDNPRIFDDNAKCKGRW